MMKFINDVRNELQFVKWPTKKMVAVSTVAVLIISAIVAIILAGADLGLSKLLTFITK